MRKKMSEIVDIIDGDRGTNYPKQDDFSENGFCLFLNTGNVRKEGFSFETNVFITKEKDSALRKGKLQRDDIVYTTRGTVGNVGYYSSKVRYEHIRINSGMVIFRAIDTNVSMSFLYHLLRSKDVRKEFLSYCTGSAQPQLPIKILKEIKVDIPDIEIQQRIVSILSSYDDLIENNQKQIKLLEEAAQRLYKEWFVDLRFPGHEDVEIVDGVPKGWEWKRLGEVATVNKYGIPKNYRESFIDYIDLSSVSSGSITNVSRYNIEDAPGRAKRIAKCGDIIWGMVRPNLKSYALVMNDTPTNIYSTGFAVITAEEVPYSFLYTLVTREEFVGYLVNCTNGAAYPAVKPVHFEDALIMVPEQGALDKFALIVNPLFEKIYALNKYNKCLQEARDRLLPKLMSGEVEV